MTQTPELETLKRITEKLDASSMPYMLTGSMAMNFYGHARATQDFDIVIALPNSSAENLIAIFQKEYYVAEQAVRDAVSIGGLFNIIDNKTVFKIDLIVKKLNPYSDEQFNRKEGLRNLQV